MSLSRDDNYSLFLGGSAKEMGSLAASPRMDRASGRALARAQAITRDVPKRAQDKRQKFQGKVIAGRFPARRTWGITGC